MKTIKSRFSALISSIGALIGSCGGACGVACAASGCCSYALFGVIGISSSSMHYFEKLTPFFLLLTIFSLAYAFYKAYKPKDVNCCDSENNQSGSDCCPTDKKTTFFQSKSFLWAITVISAIMWAYPYFSKLNTNDSSCNTKSEMIDKTIMQGDNSKTECSSKATDCSTKCSTE